MIQYLKECFNHTGRWNRQKFWLYPIGVSLLLFVPYGVCTLLLFPGEGEEPSKLFTVISMLIVPIYLASIYVTIVSYIKRLRDLDKNPWMTLLILIPFVNLWLMILCGFWKGTPGVNQYGPNPLGNTGAEEIDALKGETNTEL